MIAASDSASDSASQWQPGSGRIGHARTGSPGLAGTGNGRIGLMVREVPDPPYQPMWVWRRADHGRRRPRDRRNGRRSLAAARRQLRVGYAAAAGDAFVRPSGFFARPSLHSAAAEKRVRWPCRPGFGF